MRWEKLQLQKEGEVCSGPGKRWGHTCNAIKGGRFLYVFGGYGKDNRQTNQVHVFDTTKQTWSQPEVKGTPPRPRDSHTCTTVGDNLFVFGGTDGTKPLNDLHFLDTSSHTWVCPNFRGEEPEAREGHSAALVGKRIFVIGGSGKSATTNDDVYYNDVCILNTETFVWQHAVTTGTPPSKRDSHSCSSWMNKIIVVGGEDGHDLYLSDVHILDADTLIWKKLDTSGQILPPRAGHSTVAFGKILFVFGGFTDAQNLFDDLYMLDTDTGLWTKIMTMGEKPSARFSVAGDCLDPLKGGVLVFSGGCNKDLEALDDMYYLYTGIGGDYAMDERRLDNLSMRKQLKLKCQEQNLANSLYDQPPTRIDMGSDVLQPMPIVNFTPILNQAEAQGKKSFQAKISESFPYGYTIETFIDGKLLRGILFSNKPSSIPATNTTYNGKRAVEEIGVNGDSESKSKALKSDDRQDSIDNHQADADKGKEETSPHEMETDSMPHIKDQSLLVTCQTNNKDIDIANTKPAPVPIPLDLNDYQVNETPDTGNEVADEVMCVEHSVAVPQSQD